MCIFCKIVKKEIPCSCVYEDDVVMAFLDLSQVTKGHTLVIPKQHFESILECDDETLAHVMRISKKLANQLVDKLNANGINILSNAKEAAGQTVPHFHVHLIPRYDEQDACVIEFKESKPQNLDEVLKEILK